MKLIIELADHPDLDGRIQRLLEWHHDQQYMSCGTDILIGARLHAGTEPAFAWRVTGIQAEPPPSPPETGQA